MADAYREHPANALAQSIQEHSGSRTAGALALPANGAKAGTPGMRCRTVTGIHADSSEIARRGTHLHYPLGSLKKPDKQSTASNVLLAFE